MTTENTIPSFVHLHLNTNYSLYHSLVESGEAARISKETGMTACACTDHGTLSAAMKFKSALESQGIKPIYGCEFLVSSSIRSSSCKSSTSSAACHWEKPTAYGEACAKKDAGSGDVAWLFLRRGQKTRVQ